MAVDPEIRRTPPSGGGYETPQEALKSVASWFGSWTQALSERSVELSYALVAANWAVFGSKDKLLASSCAKLSLGLVVVFLGVNLILTRIMAEVLRRRFSYAEADPTRWVEEFERTKGTPDPWPSTTAIDGVARLLREARTWLPLGAGIAFLFAVFLGS